MKQHRFFTRFAWLATLAAFATSARAATIYWDGVSGSWGTVGNWSTSSSATTPDPTLVPGSSDDVVFNISTVNNAETITLGAARAAKSLTFNNTSTTLLRGNAPGTTTARNLTIGTGGITVAATAGAVTISDGTDGAVNMVLSGSQTWQNNSSSALTFGGTVNIGAGNVLTLNAAGSGDILLNGNTSANTGALTINSAGSGAVTLAGSGNAHTGNTTLTAGKLYLNSARALGPTSGAGTFIIQGGTIDNTTAGAITLSSNNAQQWDGDFTFTGTQSLNLGTGAVTLGGTRQVTVNNNTLTVGGVIGDGGNTRGITKAGAGTLALTSASSDYTGVTTINNGTLTASTIANINTVSSIGKGSVAGSAADLVFGGGALSHTAANVASTDRLFTIGNASGLTATLDSSASSSANTLSFTGTGAIAFGGSGARTLTLAGSNTGANTFAPVLGDGTGGATSLIKTNAGTWVLTGANTYSGTTTLSDGRVKVGVNSVGSVGAITSSAIGTGGLTFNGGVLSSDSATARTILNAVTFAADATIGNSTDTGKLTFSANVGLGAATRTLSFSSDAEFGGVVSATGAYGITKAGTGVLTLSGTSANTYSGLTTINIGEIDLNKSAGVNAIAGDIVIGDGTSTDTLKLLADNQIADTSVVTLNSSGVFDLNGHTEAVGSVTNAGKIAFNTGAGTLTAANLFLTGTGSVTFNSGTTPSTLIVSGAFSNDVNTVISNTAGGSGIILFNGYTSTAVTNKGLIDFSSGAGQWGQLMIRVGTDATRNTLYNDSSGTIALRLISGGTGTLKLTHIFSNMVVNAGMLTLSNASSIARTIELQVTDGITNMATGTIRFDNTSAGASAHNQNRNTLTSAVDVVNFGTITARTLTTGAVSTNLLAVGSGVFSNALGGRVILESDNVGVFVIQAPRAVNMGTNWLQAGTLTYQSAPGTLGILENSGTILVEGGTLQAATVTNTLAGVIKTASGAGTLAAAVWNAGTINAAGGVLQLGSPVNNTGSIQLNGGLIAASAGATITNLAGGWLGTTSGNSGILSNVTVVNAGVISLANGQTLTFAGGSLTNTTTGYILGNGGTLVLSNASFWNVSTANTSWNMAGGTTLLMTNTSGTYYLTAAANSTLGNTFQGTNDNFFISTLSLAGASTVKLTNGVNGAGNSTLYVGALNVGTGTTLDLQGGTIYYADSYVNSGTVINGSVIQLISAQSLSFASSGGSFDWQSSGNWQAATIPTPNDTALLTNALAATVTFHTNATTTVANLVVSNNVNSAAHTLLLSNGFFAVSAATTVGSNGVIQIGAGSAAAVMTNASLTLAGGGSIVLTNGNANALNQLVVTGILSNSANTTITFAGTAGVSNMITLTTKAFTNAGTVASLGGSNFIRASSAVNAGTNTLAGGVLSYQDTAGNELPLVNNGAVLLSGGTLATALTNTSAGLVSGAGTLSGALRNFGTVRATNGTLIVAGVQTNAGTYEARSSGTLQFGATAERVLTNDALGLVLMRGGWLVAAEVRNYGVVANAEGTSIISNGMINMAGGYILATNGTLVLTPDLQNFGTVTNTATLQVGSTGQGSVTNAGLIQMAGGTVASGVITNTGTLRGYGQVDGTVINAAAGFVVATNGTLVLTSNFQNDGTVTNATTLQIGATGQGSVTNAGTILMSNGTLLAGTVTNGALRGYGQVGGTVINAAGGSLRTDTSGQTLYLGDVVNQGLVTVITNASMIITNSLDNSGGVVELRNNGTTPAWLVVSNQYLNTSSSQITNWGTGFVNLLFAGSSITNSGSISFVGLTSGSDGDTAAVVQVGATGTGWLRNAGTITINANNDRTVVFSNQLVNTGNLVLQGPSSATDYSNRLVVVGGGAGSTTTNDGTIRFTRVSAAGGVRSVLEIATGGLVNNGVILDTTANAATNLIVVAQAGQVFSNAPSGVISRSSVGGTGALWIQAPTIVNAGVITNSALNPLMFWADNFVNSGWITNNAQVTVAARDGGATAVMVNTAGATIYSGEGTTITVSGTLDQRGIVALDSVIYGVGLTVNNLYLQGTNYLKSGSPTAYAQLTVTGTFTNTTTSLIDRTGIGGLALIFTDPTKIVTNQGVFDLTDGNSGSGQTNTVLQVGNNTQLGTFYNSGTVMLGGAATDTKIAVLSNQLVNAGTFLVTNNNGSGKIYITGTGTGAAVTNLYGGTFRMVKNTTTAGAGGTVQLENGGFVNAGRLESWTGGTTMSNTVRVADGSAFSNAATGVVVVETGSTGILRIQADRAVNLGTNLLQGGTLTYQTAAGAAGILENYGVIQLSGGALGDGTVTNASGGLITGSAGTISADVFNQNGGVISNNAGTWLMSGTLTNLGTFVVANGGLVSNTAVVSLLGNTARVDNAQWVVRNTDLNVGVAGGTGGAVLIVTNGGTLRTTSAQVGNNASNNLVSIVDGGIWNGSGQNLTNGIGVDGISNLVRVSGGTLTNFGALVIGANGASGNRLVVTNATVVGGALTIGSAASNNVARMEAGAFWNMLGSNVTVGASGGTGNVFEAVGGVLTNVGRVTIGDSATTGNRMVASNASLWTGELVIGNGASNNTVSILDGAVWNLGGGALTWGAGQASNNTLVVSGSGVLTNVGALNLGDGGRTVYLTNQTLNGMVIGFVNAGLNIGTTNSLGRSVLVMSNETFTSGAASTVGRFSSSNSLVVLAGTTWNGGGQALTNGVGAGAVSNNIAVTGGTLTNFGAVVVGAAGAANNALTATNANLWTTGLIIGSGASNNTVSVLDGTTWNLGGGALTWGAGQASNNTLVVSGSGVLTNVGGLNLGDGGRTVYFTNNTLNGLNVRMSGGGLNIGTTNSLGRSVLVMSNQTYTSTAASTIGNFSSTNAILVQSNVTWNGGNQTLTVGSGVGGSNVLSVTDGTLTNFGAVVVGAAGSENNLVTVTNANLWSRGLLVGNGGSNNTVLVNRGAQWNLMGTNIVVGSGAATGNLFQINSGIVSNVQTLVATGANNRVVFNAGTLSVNNMIYSNTFDFTAGDGVSTARLALVSGTSRFEGNLIIASNATLQGAGSVLTGSGKNLVIQNGATLAPGNSPGILTADNVLWNGGSFFQLEVTNFAGAAGAAWDRLDVSGALTITSGGNPFTIKLDSMGLSAAGVNFDANNEYALQFATFGSQSGFDPSQFVVNTTAFGDGSYVNNWGVTMMGNSLYLTYTALTYTPSFVWSNAVDAPWSQGSAWTNGSAPPVNGNTTLVVQFDGSGAASYIATNDRTTTGVSGMYTNNKIVFNSSSTGTNTLAGATLVFDGASAVVAQQNSGMFIISNQITLATNVTFGGIGIGQVVVASNITGAGQITKRGAWDLVLQGSNSFAGQVLVNSAGGTLTLDNPYAIGANSLTISNGTVFVRTNTTFYVGNGWSNQTVLITGSSSLWTNTDGMTVGADAARSNAVVVANGGRLTVTGNFVIGTNGAAYNSLIISNSGQVIRSGTGTTTTTNSYIGYSASSSNTVQIIGGGSSLTPSIWNNGGQYVYVGYAANSVSNSLIVDGRGVAGSAVLTNVQIYVGAAALSAQNNLMVVTNGGLVIRGGAGLTYVGDSGARSNTLIIVGGGSGGAGSVWDNKGQSVRVGSRTSSSTTIDYNRLIVDGNGVAGGAVLTNVGTLTVGYNMNENQMIITNGARVSSSGAVNVGEQSGVSFRSANNSVRIDGGAANSIWNLSNATMVIGAGVAGGTAAVTNNNVYVGTGGILTNLNVVIGLGAARTNALVMNGGQVLASSLIATSAGNRVELNSGTLSSASTVYSNGADFVVGAGAQAAAFVMTGGGNHFFQNNLVVTNGGLFAGAGSVTAYGAGGVIVKSGGAFSPGVGSGTMTNMGDMTLAGGSIYRFDINNFAGTAGSANGWDYLYVNGALANQGVLTIDLVSLATNNNLSGLATGFDADGNYAITNAFATTFNNIGSFTVVATNFQNSWDGIWTASQQGNYLVLNYEGSRVYYWTNYQGSVWNSSAWTNNGVAATPTIATTNTILVFGGNTAYTSTNNFGSDFILKQVRASNDAATVTLVGNDINFAYVSPRLVQDGAGALVISNGVAIISSNAMAFTGGGAGTVYVAGSITNPVNGAGILKDGTYTLVLSGTNSLINGTATISNGTVVVASTNALRGSTVNSAVAGGVIFSNVTGATFGGLAGNVDLNLTNTANQGVALTVSNNTATYAGSLRGSGSLTKAGDGTQTLAGTNTYTGVTIVNGGTLAVSGQLASTNLTVNNGNFVWGSTEAMSNVSVITINTGNVLFSSSGTIAGLAGYGGQAVVSNNATLQVGYGGVTTNFGGMVTGNGTLTKVGGGTWTLTGTGSSISNVVVNSGTIAMTAGSLTATNFYVNSTGTFALSGGSLAVRDAVISNGANFVVGNGLSAASFRVLGGTASLQKDLIATNGASVGGLGTITVAGGQGTVAITSGGQLVAGANGTTGTLTINGTNLWMGGGSYVMHFSDFAGTAGSSSGWDWLNVNGVLTNAATSGNPFVINVGAFGAVSNFNISAFYTNIIATGVSFGGTNLESFSVVATNLYAQNPFDGVFSLKILDGTNLALVYQGVADYTWNFGTGVTSVGSHWLANSAPNLGQTNATINFLTGTYTVTNDIVNLLTKRITLSNDNGAVNTFVGNSFNLVGIAPELVQNGSSQYIFSNGLVFSSVTTLKGSGTGTLTMAGTLSGTHGFDKTSDWTLVIQGSNTFTGTVGLLGGVTIITNQYAFGDTANSVMITNATLRVTDSFSSPQSFTVSNAVVDVTPNSAYTISGGMNNGGGVALIKTNAGTLALGGAGVVSGQIQVKEGTLLINGGTWNGAITNMATLAFSNAGNAVVNGSISGSGGLTMQGSGTLTLRGDNTGLQGGLSIYSGTVAVTNDYSLGAANAAVTMSNGTLQALANYTSSRNITLSGNATGTLRVDANVTNTWAGTITSDGGLTKAGAGVLNLTASNTYLGATVINGGTLRMNGTLSSSANAVTIASGGTLAGTGTILRAVSLSNGGTITAGNGAPGKLTITGADLTWNGGGTYQVFIDNWTGTDSDAGTKWSDLVVNGNLILAGYSASTPYIIDLTGNPLGTLGGANTNWLIATASGGISGLNAAEFSILTTNLTASVDGIFSVKTVGNNLYLTYAAGYIWTNLTTGTWSDTVGYWKGGAAPPNNQSDTALIFQGSGVASNNHASFMVNRLTFDIGAGSNQVLTGGELVFSGSGPQLVQSGNGPVTISNNLVLAKALSMSGSGYSTVTVAGVISGSNGFTKTGSWALNLQGANTFTGAVSITGGILGLGNVNSLGYTGNAVAINGVVLTPGAGVNVEYNPMALTGSNTLALGGSAYTMAGALSGSGSLTKTGNGDLVIAVNTMYSGNTIMQGTGNLIFSNSGYLSYGGVITGADMQVIRSGSGTVTLSGANTYTGNTVVVSGTLIAGASVLPDVNGPLGKSTNAVQVSGAASALLLGGNSGGLTFGRDIVASSGAKIGGANGAGVNVFSTNITVSGGVVLTAASGGRTRFDGAITGSGGLTVSGAGVVEMAGANTYGGNTTVTNGILVVNRQDGRATSSGQVLVNAGGTLAGTGMVVNSTVNRGGKLAPGEYLTVGKLTLSNSTWFAGGTYSWQITNTWFGNTPVNGAGVAWDYIAMTNLDLTALSSSDRFNISLDGVAWTNAFTALQLAPTDTNTFLIARAENGAFLATYTNLFNVSFSQVTNGYSWWLSTGNSNRDLYLNYGYNGVTALVIPEPNVLLLWLSSIATIYAARRRLGARKNK